MASFICKCGERLSDTEAPNDVKLRVYTDREWDDIVCYDSIDPLKIPYPKYDVWRCNVCERVYFFEWGYSEPTKVYSLEK